MPATRTIAALAVALILAQPEAARAGEAEARSPWFLTFYGGQWLDKRLNRILRLRASTRDFRSSYAAGVGLGREVFRARDLFRIEIEAHVLQHFGRQSHQEGNIVAIARWTRFPWDPLIDTSIALGEGLSFATRRPRIENGDDTRRLLNHLMVELELDPVPESPWSLVGRIHHRSGAFGLFGTSGGSNLILLGLRYRP